MENRKLARNAKVLRQQRAAAADGLKEAVEALIAGSLSETARELLTDQLRLAHEEAEESGLYEAFDGEDPIIPATQKAVRLLFPLIEGQVVDESGRPTPAGEQKEVSALNLRSMAMRILGLDEDPADKVSRWLGFIQGVLAVRGRLQVSEERAATRSIFHAAHRLIGFEPPASVDLSKDLSDEVKTIDLKAQDDGEMFVINREIVFRPRLLILNPGWEPSEP